MKRYLAFAGNYIPEQHLGDYRGGFDNLLDAKAVVTSRDAEGFPDYEWGTVLDTQTGKAHNWTTDGRAFGSDEWRFPVCLEAK